MSKIIDIQIEKSTRLIKALRANMAEFKDKGISEAQLDGMSHELELLEQSSKKAEGLRAKLSEQVKNTNSILAHCKEEFAKTKAVVRNNYPQEEWINYGVADKR